MGPLAANIHPIAGCAALCTLANLVTKVAMKLMSTHFHKEAHFQRMQEALRKVGDTNPPGKKHSHTHRRLCASCLRSACLSVHLAPVVAIQHATTYNINLACLLPPSRTTGVLPVGAVPAAHAAAQRSGRRGAAPRPLLCAPPAGQPDLQQGGQRLCGVACTCHCKTPSAPPPLRLQLRMPALIIPHAQLCALAPFPQSMAAMHTLPSMVKSITAGHHLRQQGIDGQPSVQDSGTLLGEGSQLSDAELAAGHTAGTAGGYLDHAPSRSPGSASQALTSVSVVVNAGVEPSARSAPNLLPPALRTEPTPSFDARSGLAAAEAVQQLRQPSRLARMGHASREAAAEATVAWAGSADTGVCGRAGSGSPPRLHRQLSPQAAAIAAAAAAAAQPGLRPSLASRQASFMSDPNAPPSFTFAQVG